MLTECPSCLTVFRVTGAILKVGHGQVRCGKCRTQFDALDSLLDEEEEPTGAIPDKRRDTEPEAGTEEEAEDLSIEARPPETAEEITLEGSRIEISGTYRMPKGAARDSDEPQIVHEHVVIDREERESEADEVDVEDVAVFEINVDDGEPVDEVAQRLRDESSDAEDLESEAAPKLAPISQRLWKRAAEQQAAHREIEAELHALSRPEREPKKRGVWIGVAVAMAIVLAAQIIHHERDELVRNPKWGGTVARMYRTLGVPLAPNWDLKAYELQVWDVTLGSERDTLRVRASVTNTAAFAQPYPLIKLALEDRWGGVVALRAFAPAEYLPSNAQADRMMAPRQRANAEIAVVDPGADAVGFKSYPCLPTEGLPMKADADIHCSDDLVFAEQ